MRLVQRIVQRLLVRLPNELLFRLSAPRRTRGRPTLYQRVVIKGAGQVTFETPCAIGVPDSPLHGDRRTYIEARDPQAAITIGRGTHINNGAILICDKTAITIGRDCLLGFDVTIVDSNFHRLNPQHRREPDQSCRPVILEENVFIGSHVRILKGVTIGRNSVVGMGSVVSESIPPDCICTGNPARVVRQL